MTDFEHREQGLGQRDIDDLAASRSLTLVERDQGADQRVHRRDRVAEAEPDPSRWAVRLAGDVAEPAGGLGDRPEPGLLAERACLAVAGDADHDEPRIGRDEVLGIQVPLLEPAGSEVLDEHVALEREPANERLVGSVVKVRRHRPLAARLDEVPERLVAVGALAPPPQADRRTPGARS